LLFPVLLLAMTKEEYGFLYGIGSRIHFPFRIDWRNYWGPNVALYMLNINAGSLYWAGFILGLVLLLAVVVEVTTEEEDIMTKQKS